MIVKAKAVKGTKGLRRAIDYILSEGKAAMKAVRNLSATEDFVLQIEEMSKLWGKNSGRMGYHFIFSFDPRDDVTNALALRVANKIILEAFPNHHTIFAVHNDTHHIHVHVVVGAVNLLSGRKLNLRKEDYRKLKDIGSEVAVEYGLSKFDWREATRKKREEERLGELPEQYSFAEKGLQQRGASTWKGELRNIIDECVIGTINLEEFKKKLAEKNVILTRCSSNVISYKFGEHRAVRGDTLGGDYTMAAIQDALRYYREWPDTPVSGKDRQLYREWARQGGVRRSEVDAICDELHSASWTQKQAVFAEYKQIKDDFWNEYRRRKEKLQKAADEAYRRRQLIKEAEWLLSPYNRKRCLAGIIFAAIICHQHGNREQIEREIQELRRRQDQLRKECQAFQKMSDDALQTLREKGLSLDTYLEQVWRMQECAEDMFRQPTEEQVLLWRLERNALVQEPTLKDYLERLAEDQNPQEYQVVKDDERGSFL